MPDYKITGALTNLPAGVTDFDVVVYNSNSTLVGHAYVDISAGTDFEVEAFLNGYFWLEVWAFGAGGVIAARILGPYDPVTVAEEITPP